MQNNFERQRRSIDSNNCFINCCQVLICLLICSFYRREKKRYHTCLFVDNCIANVHAIHLKKGYIMRFHIYKRTLKIVDAECANIFVIFIPFARKIYVLGFKHGLFMYHYASILTYKCLVSSFLLNVFNSRANSKDFSLNKVFSVCQ